MNVLEVADIRKRFDDLEAVRGVSFSIGPGETYGLLGPNGAGKTTSISMIAGLLEKSGGEVRVNGDLVDTRSVKPKRAIGLVPQELAVYPELTGLENLRFFGRLYGLPRDELTRRCQDVLEVIGLADRAGDRASEYSGGMKRRLNIGIGLLHKPRLLILDEPTVGVDPQSRNAILESVEHLSDEGMAVLYTTHYMEEAERLCDRVGIIDDGLIAAEGTRRQLVDLIGESDRVVVSTVGSVGQVADELAVVEGVTSVSTTDHRIELLTSKAAHRLPEFLGILAAAGVGVNAIEVEEPDLEAVFLHLTGKALRD